MREIHFHSLPWPTNALVELGGTEVRLRVTLSYFVEPNPGSRGWVRRYAYASHGLRFDVRRATESNDDFRKRLNALARAEGETPNVGKRRAELVLRPRIPRVRVAAQRHLDGHSRRSRSARRYRCVPSERLVEGTEVPRPERARRAVLARGVDRDAVAGCGHLDTRGAADRRSDRDRHRDLTNATRPLPPANLGPARTRTWHAMPHVSVVAHDCICRS